MRTIEHHKLDESDVDALKIEAGPEAEAGASYDYVVAARGKGKPLAIRFGLDGVTHEALLAVLIDRFEGFQRGPMNCIENEYALSHLRAAIEHLKGRTRGRRNRGVEGTQEP